VSVAIAVQTQDVWPPRVQVSVTGLTVGDDLAVYRVVAGARSLLRGSSVDDIGDTALVVVDAELPFGVPVSYVATVDVDTEYATAPTTYTLPGGMAALTDAITGLSAEVAVGAADPQTYSRDSSRFRVGGRNIMVSGPAGQAESSYEFAVTTTEALEDLLTLLAGATEGIVQLRQPGGYVGFDGYLAVDGWQVGRLSQDGRDQKRKIVVDYAEVDGWPPLLEARGFSYGDVATFYTGLTYADASADFATYLDALLGDFS
jgi:hypothetical protein